jgi:hypothetical protein
MNSTQGREDNLSRRKKRKGYTSKAKKEKQKNSYSEQPGVENWRHRRKG